MSRGSDGCRSGDADGDASRGNGSRSELHPIHISRDLEELASHVLNWGCMKLAGREGFTVLMMTRRDGEKYMTRIDKDSVEEALAYAEKSLIDGSDVGSSDYVLGYDVTVRVDDKPRRGFFLELESEDMPVCVVMFRATNAGDIPGKEPDEVVPEGDFVVWEMRAKRLPVST